MDSKNNEPEKKATSKNDEQKTDNTCPACQQPITGPPGSMCPECTNRSKRRRAGE